VSVAERSLVQGTSDECGVSQRLILSIYKALEQLMVPDLVAVKSVANRVHPLRLISSTSGIKILPVVYF
jgi:hypothetical protein